MKNNSIVIIPVIIFAIYTTIETNRRMDKMYSKFNSDFSKKNE
jgi:hypothetical protein